jgi:hypothetical protein
MMLGPWGIVADVALVATFQHSNPIARDIEVVVDDLALNPRRACG